MTVIVLDPSIGSLNVGDQIIQQYAAQELRRILPDEFLLRLPTQDYLAHDSLKKVRSAEHVIVAGSNLLTSEMNRYRQWKVRLIDVPFMGRKVVLMGVGWWQYQRSPNFYTRTILRNVLSAEGIHSARDEYTKRMLAEAGVRNVLNTGCPTLWGMTAERCRMIPADKADAVVTTLTDYSRDPAADRRMLEILVANYRERAIWLQGSRDREYLESLGEIRGGLQVLGPTLEAFTAFLTRKGHLDYIGTRLHAGIHAMNHSRRSVVVAVDNRALEKKEDMGLPVVSRGDADALERAVFGGWRTEIRVPWDNIERWKRQFSAQR